MVTNRLMTVRGLCVIAGEDYKDYFWMSYDTVSLLDTAWAFDFTGTDNYDNNYQLDGGIGTFKVSNYTRL